MTKYDELCEVAVSNYGLVTAKMIDALGIHLKDVLEWALKEWRRIYGCICDCTGDSTPDGCVWLFP